MLHPTTLRNIQSLPPIVEEAEIRPRFRDHRSNPPRPRHRNDFSDVEEDMATPSSPSDSFLIGLECMPPSSYNILLSFLPSRQVIRLSIVSPFLREMVNDYNIFEGYCLRVSAGKRANFLSRRQGNKTVLIDDDFRIIEMNTNSRSPRVELAVTHILTRLSKSKISRVDFLRIHESVVSRYLVALRTCPILIVTIGEQCQSWNWSTIVSVFQSFPRVTDVQIAIAGFESSLPAVRSRGDWLAFIQSLEPYIMNLQRLCCVDDALLRVILGLCANRNHYVASYAQDFPSGTPRPPESTRNLSRRSLPRGSSTPEFPIADGRIGKSSSPFIPSEKPIAPPTSIRTIGRRFERRDSRVIRSGSEKNTNSNTPSLTFVSYGCQFLPTTPLTGKEFEGVRFLEITPYDDMVIHIPSCIISLRISRKEFSESGTWRINVNKENNIFELCLFEIRDLGGFKGMGNLERLKYLSIHSAPESTDDIVNAIATLRRKSPLRHVSFCFEYESSFLRTIGSFAQRLRVKLHSNYVKPPFVEEKDIQFSLFRVNHVKAIGKKRRKSINHGQDESKTSANDLNTKKKVNPLRGKPLMRGRPVNISIPQTKNSSNGRKKLNGRSTTKRGLTTGKKRTNGIIRSRSSIHMRRQSSGTSSSGGESPQYISMGF